MSPSADEYRAQIERLVAEGADMLSPKYQAKVTGVESPAISEADMYIQYPLWFTEASEVVMRLLPERLHEFVSMYYPSADRTKITKETYTIQDWILDRRSPGMMSGGRLFDDKNVVLAKLLAQIMILKSSLLRFDSALLNIRQLELADLFDSELDAAEELLQTGFIRPAGVVAGVVLERHLKELCIVNGVETTKQKPSLGDYNKALKDAGVFDTPRWRSIGWLVDIRNLCGHEMEREPTRDEVTGLIDGVGKTIKTT